MYKITIKGQNPGVFTYAQMKSEKMEKVIVTDTDGNDTIELKGTGEYFTEDFHTEDFEEAKDKYLELIKTHRIDELNIIDDVTEKVTVNIELADSVDSDEV